MNVQQLIKNGSSETINLLTLWQDDWGKNLSANKLK